MHNVREILPQKFENGKKKLFITRCFLVLWMKNINNNNIPGFTCFQVTFHMTTSFLFHLKIRMAHTETLLYSLCQLPFIFFNIMSKNSCLWIPNFKEFKLLYYIQTIIIGNIVNIYGILYLFHCFSHPVCLASSLVLLQSTSITCANVDTNTQLNRYHQLK